MAARFYVTVHRHSRVVVPHLLTNVSVALVQLSEGKEGKFQPAERLKFSMDKVKVNGWTADKKHSNEMTLIKINMTHAA